MTLQDIIVEGEKAFDLLWGIAPPSSAKGLRGAELKSFLRSQQITLLEGVCEALEGMKKVCHFCKEDFHSKNHYQENGIYYCIPKSQAPTNRFPTVDIVGSEKDDGHNAALTDAQALITSVITDLLKK